MELIEKLKSQYETGFPLASQFAAELSRQLSSLVENDGIKLGFPIQARVKLWPSIDDKIKRLKLDLENLQELQDWVGLRLTLVFLRDAKRLKKLLEKTFDVVKSYNTSDRLGNDQFGYSSFHLVLKVPKAWSAVPSLAHFKNFQAEIQIRTLAQHIWAEVSHQLQYKNEGNVPPDILRSIYRSSALLETVDLEFERVLSERDVYRDAIKEGVDIKFTDDNINSDNIDVLLDELLPSSNKSEDGEDYSELIDECFALGVNKISELRDIISRHHDTMIATENKIFSERLNDYEQTGTIYGNSKERLQRGVYFTFVGLVRQALSGEFGDSRVMDLIFSHNRSRRKAKSKNRLITSDK